VKEEERKGPPPPLTPPAAAAAARAASRRQRPQRTPPHGQKMTPPACPSLNPVFESLASPLLVLGTPLWTWVLRPRLAARHENTILSGLCSPETPPFSPNFGYGYIIH